MDDNERNTRPLPIPIPDPLGETKPRIYAAFVISRSITGDGGGMARIGRSKSDVALDNKHSPQYYRRGMMDVLTRRFFLPPSFPFPPPIRFFPIEIYDPMKRFPRRFDDLLSFNRGI